MGNPDKTAAFIAEKLRKAIEEHVFDIEGRDIRITISLGVATLTKAMEMEHEEELIQLADRNLYRAKNSGRNKTWTESDTAKLEKDNQPPVEIKATV